MSDPVLAIGPANYAGQAHRWAQAVDQHLSAAAWSFTRGPVRRGGFAFDASVTIPAPLFHASIFRRRRSRRLFRRTTHIALDGYQPYFRLLRGDRVFAKDARWLERSGFAVALVAHGTDVRDPDAHRDRLRWSYFSEGTAEWRDLRRRAAARNRLIAEELGVPLFVSTPDLLLDQPSATWLPLAVDLPAFASDEPVLEREIPRVLHLPSRRDPPIKGTQYIDPIMRKLEQEGLLEYVSPASVPHAQMPALVKGCDIVVDQVLSGVYGVAAVEAMAAGRVLIGSLAPDVATLLPERPDLHDANPDSLEIVVRHILADRDAARQKAKNSIAYARRWHDGRAAANALAGFLGVNGR